MINSKFGHTCMLLPTRVASILISHSHFLFVFFSFRFIWKLVALPVLSRGTFPLKKWTHIGNKFLSLVFLYGIVFFCGSTLTLTPTITILGAILWFSLLSPPPARYCVVAVLTVLFDIVTLILGPRWTIYFCCCGTPPPLFPFLMIPQLPSWPFS